MPPVQTTASGGDWSPLGYGTWKLPNDAAKSCVEEAIRIGYRHVDCASIYGNEKEVGEGLSGAMGDGLVKRGDLWVTSKLWNHSHSRVREACLQTLADLKLDYLDLYLIHWPAAFVYEPDNASPNVPRDAAGAIKWDPISLRETWQALEALVDEGKVRHLGVSNFGGQLLQDLLKYAKHKPITNQVEANPAFPNGNIRSFCGTHGLTLTAYCPLGHGSLLTEPTVVAVAESLGCTAAQVLLKWALQRGTLAIPKSVNHGRMAENFAAASLPDIGPADIEALEAIPGAKRICNPSWYGEGIGCFDS